MAERRTRVLAGAGIAMAVLAALAIVTLTTGHRHPPPARAAAGHPPDASQSSGRPTADQPSAHPWTGPSPPPIAPALMLGRAGAPVTILEFGDYQCPNCGEFARSTEPALIHRYVDTGQARLVWRDFPWVNAQSWRAAAAARAAGRQGKFWQFHDYLFTHQFAEYSGKLTDGYLRSVAQRLGLNMTQFDRDFTDPGLMAAVRADDSFGQQLDVPGTPAFLIGGKPFFGAQPLSAFQSAIGAAAASARTGQ